MGSSPSTRGITLIGPDVPMWPSSANVFVVSDDRGLILFDVGCGNEDAVSRLTTAMEEQGFHLTDVHTIVLSHAHPDHAGGIARILARIRPRLIIHATDAAAAKNLDLLPISFNVHLYNTYYEMDYDLLAFFADSGCAMSAVPPDYPLDTVQEGDHIEAGNFSFQVVHTPGHAPGHICLYDQEKKLLLSFDLVGTVPAWYSPGTGGATGFLNSLDKVEKLELEVILPSHGGPIEAPSEAIARTRSAVLKREDKILAELHKGTRSFRELNALLFKDPGVQTLVGLRITESHLVKLEKEGRIKRVGAQNFLA
jgi:glyoxylase-like metal-dependent hydrolase (beta-lactamase superfamily II)